MIDGDGGHAELSDLHWPARVHGEKLKDRTFAIRQLGEIRIHVPVEDMRVKAFQHLRNADQDHGPCRIIEEAVRQRRQTLDMVEV